MICGERRWRAARLAGLPTLSCVIADEPTDAGELLALQLIENALREDLQPIEQARAFRSLMDQRHWSTRDLARELALTQSTVVKALALLESRPRFKKRSSKEPCRRPRRTRCPSSRTRSSRPCSPWKSWPSP